MAICLWYPLLSLADQPKLQVRLVEVEPPEAVDHQVDHQEAETMMGQISLRRVDDLMPDRL